MASNGFNPVEQHARLAAYNLTVEHEREVARRERRMWDIHCSTTKVDTMKKIAVEEGWSYGSVKRWYSAWSPKKGNGAKKLAALISKRWIRNAAGESRNPFYNVFVKYCEDNKNACLPAWHAMMKDFWSGKYLDGVGTVRTVWEQEKKGSLPATFFGWVPKGATYQNLMELFQHDATRNFNLALNRQGSQAAQQYVLPVMKTRGLFRDPKTGEMRVTEAGEIMQWDDVWHNINVWYLNQLLQPLEFAGWDVGVGFKCASLMKPRFMKIDEKTGRVQHDNLKEQQFRFIFAYFHFQTGFNPRGVTHILEHGTTRISADVYEQIRGIPYYGELIRIQTSGILSEQARASMFEGLGGGNFRMKAFIESQHNKLHNLTAHLVGNKGRDAAHEHESNGNLVKVTTALYQRAEAIAPELLQKIETGLALTFEEYAEVFHALECDYMNRRDHRLEGWDTRYVTQYRFSSKMEWMGESEFQSELLTMEEGERTTVVQRVMAKPGELVRRVKMSRFEAYKADQAKFIRVPEKYMPQFLDWEKDGRTITVGENHLLALQDKLYFGNDAVQYRAKVTKTDGTMEELAPGLRVRVFFNPMMREKIWVCDLETRELIGVAAYYAKAPLTDDQAQLAAMGEQAHFLAMAKRPMRGRHAKDDYRTITMRTAFAAALKDREEGRTEPSRVRMSDPVPVLAEAESADAKALAEMYAGFVNS